MHALIYTRSRYVDYQYFAGPQELRSDKEVDAHIRNVMHEDDGGSVGDLVGKRWHVFRKGKWLIIGMATKDYGRVDETGSRPIRGYYGFVMPIESAKVPSLLLFDEIDKRFVQSVFNNATISPSDGLVDDGIFNDDKHYSHPIDFGHWRFNTDQSKVRFLVCDDIDELLRSAVAYAVKVDKFEIVIGLNTIAHAMRLPICNCMCKAVITSSDQVLKLGHGADVNLLPPRPEIVRQGSKSALGAGLHREDLVANGGRGRQLSVGDEMGGRPLFGGRREQSPLLRDVGGIKRPRRRVVIDLENDNEQDAGFWRELLSTVNRLLSLFGVRARCQIEEANAPTQKKSSLVTGKQVTDKKVVRNYLESGF